VRESNVLVVGAGGIGCELMKCLSLTGFKKCSIIDLDTIDISNLNRQFLFRREHVDMPKSKTLKESISKQNPKFEIEDFVGRIQEDRFGFTFFSKFDIVINALDNIEARNHVNMLCFNLGVPLVEAGTNGYQGNCAPIKKNVTPCYQCID
jgi:ubiquitin-like 1-activating enzyme E1 B